MTTICTSFMDLLAATNSGGMAARIEVLELPRDTALAPRYAMVVSGTESAEIIRMITDALDAHFTKSIAAHLQVPESHGPGSGAQRPD
jgi:hypothetical protein